MAKEREIMILDVDKEEVARRLKQLKAKRIGRYKYRRVEFRLNDNPSKGHSWGRVRTDGKNTVITLKRLKGDGGYNAMDEYEINTSDFEKSVKILTTIADTNLVIYFETERDMYKLGSAYVTIDKWPEIPHYVEIEAPSINEVKRTQKILNIKGKFVGNASIFSVYRRYGLSFKAVMRKNDKKLRRIVSK